LKYILVADDEPVNQEIFEEILMDDFDVTIVENGEECLESIEDRIPDLLLLDVAMPKMNGLEVCRKLRANPKTKDLPVILVSAYASQADIDIGISAGANLYISKPFKIALLLDDINSLLANS